MVNGQGLGPALRRIKAFVQVTFDVLSPPLVTLSRRLEHAFPCATIPVCAFRADTALDDPKAGFNLGHKAHSMSH